MTSSQNGTDKAISEVLLTNTRFQWIQDMYGRLVIRNIGSSMAMDERRGRINVPGQYFLLKGIQKAAINHPSLIYGFLVRCSLQQKVPP